MAANRAASRAPLTSNQAEPRGRERGSEILPSSLPFNNEAWTMPGWLERETPHAQWLDAQGQQEEADQMKTRSAHSRCVEKPGSAGGVQMCLECAGELP